MMIREFVSEIQSDTNIPAHGKLKMKEWLYNLQEQWESFLELMLSPNDLAGHDSTSEYREHQLTELSLYQKRFLDFRVFTNNLMSGSLERVWRSFEQISFLKDEMERRELILSLENIGVRRHLEKQIFSSDCNWQCLVFTYLVFSVEHEHLQDIDEQTLQRIKGLRTSGSAPVLYAGNMFRSRLMEYQEAFQGDRENVLDISPWLESCTFDFTYAEKLGRVLKKISNRTDDLLDRKRREANLSFALM